MADKTTITGHTRVLGLLGSDIGHSSSPQMHNASFDEMGVDFAYVLLDINKDDLAVVVPGLTALGFVGYNVTIPLKTYICDLLDELTPVARLMGAVNTVQIKDGKTIGHNTDGAGFTRNVKEQGYDIIGKKMTIVGAGGAGSAVFTQAAMDGVAEIDVFNIKDEFFDRTLEKVAHLSEQTGAKVTLHDLADSDDLKRSVDESAIFVNATRVGAVGMEDGCNLPEEFLHEGLIVADTVYTPRKTKLIKMAEAHGNPAIPGLGMLLWQASLAEEIWTGKTMNIGYIAEKIFSE